jgi:hypothetical protein
MVIRIDLRVHAGAPSSRRDDDRFTAQAEAYTNIQATTIYRLSAPQIIPVSQLVQQSLTNDAEKESLHDDDGQTMPPPPSSAGRDETTIVAWDPTVFLEETQLGYSALESQLIASALPITKTPCRCSARQQTPFGQRLTLQNAHVVPATSEKRSSSVQHQPASTPSNSSAQGPSQSSYLKSPVVDRANKKARVEAHTTLQTPEAAGSFAPPYSRSHEQDESDHVASNSKRPDKALQLSGEVSTGNDTTSELPTSYSLSNITTDSSRSGQQSVQRSISDPGPLAHDFGNAARGSSQPTRSTERSTPCGRLGLVQDVSSGSHSNAGEPVELPRQISPIAVKDFATIVRAPLKATTASIIAEEEAINLLAELPDIIMPPCPIVSIQPLESHITNPLRLLVEKADIADRYEPVSVTRDLRDTERGYWLFDISTWSATLQLDFFRFLTRMIGEGRVGWGIWCTRDAESADKSPVRVYCWGEVARHVYLLLYAASKSKIRKLGLQWIDAEGEAVVQMRGLDPG